MERREWEHEIIILEMSGSLTDSQAQSEAMLLSKTESMQ
jgi:hypothetical protein